jgi:Tol biopolymer transport system component
MDIDVGNLIRLTDNDYLDFQPHYNYDGAKMVYILDSVQMTAEEFLQIKGTQRLSHSKK